jgi:hypothetical protein
MKSTLFKYLKLSLALCLSLFASSCLQNETTINLNKDGSGTIVEQTILGAQMLAMMTQFAEPGQPDPVQEMFSEEKSKAKATKMGEGVEFVKIEMINEGGKKGARVHYKFADINKVNINPAGGLDAMNQGEEEEEEVKPEDLVKFKYADGKLSLITPPTNFDDMDMGDEAGENPEMEAMAKQMMADMRMTMKLNFPGGIEKTNASYVDGNSIIVMDVEVGKMFAQKDAMKKIAETAKTDKKAAKAAFVKLDGIKMEVKDDVTVTLK